MSRWGHSKGPTGKSVMIFLELLRGQVVVFNRRLPVEILRALGHRVHARNSCLYAQEVIPPIEHVFCQF